MIIYTITFFYLFIGKVKRLIIKSINKPIWAMSNMKYILPKFIF